MNYKPFQFKTYKSMRYENVDSIFQNFKPHKNEHVERIHDPKGGNVFIYFSTC